MCQGVQGGSSCKGERTVNREQWLQEAVTRLKPLFEGQQVPDVHVSVGWPSRGGTSTKKKIVGQCWNSDTSADGVPHVFISPVLEEPVEVLSTLAHELIHAIVGTEEGHKGAFVSVAKEFGFTSPWTSTPMGEDAEARLCKLADELPEYPHVKLTPTAKERKVQTTRMILIKADECGCQVRTTRKYLDIEGDFKCPHNNSLEKPDGLQDPEPKGT